MALNVKIKITAVPFVFPISAGTIEGTPEGQPGAVTPAPITPEVPASKNWQDVNLGIGVNESLIENLNEGLRKLDNVIAVVNGILKVIEFYITAFSSFATLLKAAVEGIKTQIDNFVKDFKSTGVYFNFFAPPAFYQKAPFNSQFKHMSTGGFDGFLSRLQGSFYQNTTGDIPSIPLVSSMFPSKPTFTADAYVGGMVIIADANTLDDFLKAMTALYNFFDSLDLFGVDFTPQPPVNLRGTCGVSTEFPDDLNVLLEWDPPAVTGTQWSYKIYRDTSLTNEKHMQTVAKFPKKMGDIITMIKKMFSQGSSAVPTSLEYIFKDDDGLFEQGVSVNGTSFVDTNINAVIKSDGTFDVKRTEYFYVVETVPLFSFLGGSSKSAPFRVVIKGCQDGATTSTVIDHGEGVYEKIGPGAAWQYPWMSFRPFDMVPFVDLFADTLKKVLNMISGMFNSVSNSFVDYAKAVVAKINSYLVLVGIIKQLIDAIKAIFNLPPGIYYIIIDPEVGGLTNFMTRLRSANPPEGHQFSGPTGITAGIVMLYGFPGGGSVEMEQLQKSMNLLGSLLGSTSAAQG